MPRATRHTAAAIGRDAKVRALSSPLRIEIIERLQALGPRSIAELARLLGRRRDTLYHHVRKLVAVGVLDEQGQRATGHRPERVYALTSARVAVAKHVASHADADLARRTAASVLRLTMRNLESAISARRRRGAQTPRAVMVARHKARLTAEQLADLHHRIATVQRFLERHLGNQTGDLYVLTLVLTPLRGP